MSDRLNLIQLRLSIWDHKTSGSEPVFDGHHLEVAAFLRMDPLGWDPSMADLPVVLPHRAANDSPEVPDLEVSAILSDLSYAFPAISAADWLTWYEQEVEPQLQANNSNYNLYVTYPVAGTPIQS
jgi:hypothetical protein